MIYRPWDLLRPALMVRSLVHSTAKVKEAKPNLAAFAGIYDGEIPGFAPFPAKPGFLLFVLLCYMAGAASKVPLKFTVKHIDVLKKKLYDVS